MTSRLHSVVQHLIPPLPAMFHSLGVVFIIGGGPRIGYAVANAFYQKGYKVAIGSRNPDASEIDRRGWFPITMDLADNEAIRKGFEQVRSRIGEPNVVIYNAAALTFASADDPFTLSSDDFQKNIRINLTAAYACLQETVASFKELEEASNPSRSLPRVFIATGNVVPFQPMPPAFTLGAGGAALVHLIRTGNISYRRNGYRFYWASQVTTDGGPVPFEDVDAEAHGREYIKLVTRKNLGEWDFRFT